MRHINIGLHVIPRPARVPRHVGEPIKIFTSSTKVYFIVCDINVSQTKSRTWWINAIQRTDCTTATDDVTARERETTVVEAWLYRVSLG